MTTMSVEWIGWDGSEWDLCSGPVRLTADGIEGLGALEHDIFSRSSAVSSGRQVTGWNARPRDVFLPIYLADDDTSSFVALVAAWNRTMRVDRPGTLRVTVLEQTRTLTCRFETDGPATFGHDPVQARRTVAGYTMTADDPWWYGAEISEQFGSQVPESNFFGGSSGYGPPFIITAGNTTGEASVSNPGDVEGWPTWEQDGPSTGIRFVVDGHEIAGDVAIPNGSTLIVDTDPRSQRFILRDNTTLVETSVPWWQFDQVDFARIADGDEVLINVVSYGTGENRMRLRPRYFRAWG